MRPLKRDGEAIQRREIPEQAIVLRCEDEESIGVLTEGHLDTGFVIVVGGPQYRVGSHRMFVRLARALSARGYPAFRFDVRGMGDSSAKFPSFERISPDIAAAINALTTRAGCRRVVLFGLCDGASAVAMYACHDARVAGISLINPWVRTEASESRAMLEGYYGKRLLQMPFWRGVIRGEVNVFRSVVGLLGAIRKSSRADAPVNYIERMRSGLDAYEGLVHVGLSGQDFVAMEFTERLKDSRWSAALSRDTVRVDRFPKADHTFSGDGELAVLIDAILDRFQSLEDRKVICPPDRKPVGQ